MVVEAPGMYRIGLNMCAGADRASSTAPRMMPVISPTTWPPMSRYRTGLTVEITGHVVENFVDSSW